MLCEKARVVAEPFLRLQACSGAFKLFKLHTNQPTSSAFFLCGYSNLQAYRGKLVGKERYFSRLSLCFGAPKASHAARVSRILQQQARPRPGAQRPAFARRKMALNMRSPAPKAAMFQKRKRQVCPRTRAIRWPPVLAPPLATVDG